VSLPAATVVTSRRTVGRPARIASVSASTPVAESTACPGLPGSRVTPFFDAEKEASSFRSSSVSGGASRTPLLRAVCRNPRNRLSSPDRAAGTSTDSAGGRSRRPERNSRIRVMPTLS
jgi:hypothetical protein